MNFLYGVPNLAAGPYMDQPRRQGKV